MLLVKPSLRLSSIAAALLATTSLPLHAQPTFTWEQVKNKFESTNPTLKADAINVQEMSAEEITADLRPNPSLAVSEDGTQIAPNQGVWKPLSGVQVQASLSYLHERDHKRDLRLKSAQQAIGVATAQHLDLERNLLFNLRSAFVQTLQAKAVVKLSREELGYYDHIIDISQQRFHAGDLAQVDLDRIELQRVQYEADLQTAEVTLRTAKIQLLQLLDDKTPTDQFDVAGPFDFSDQLQPLDDFRQIALAERPDLKAALESVEQAKTNHKLAVSNGSTDPTLSAWYTYNPSFQNPYANQTLGLSVSVPLRVFDRNQGEKQRTDLDIGKSQQTADATNAQVFADVDSAYAQLSSNLILLRPYKSKYLGQAARVRDTITFSWQHGGASLMDFLNAQSDYRNVQLAYAQLIGSYLIAAGQLNLAVGREVIQ